MGNNILNIGMFCDGTDCNGYADRMVQRPSSATGSSLNNALFHECPLIDRLDLISRLHFVQNYVQPPSEDSSATKSIQPQTTIYRLHRFFKGEINLYIEGVGTAQDQKPSLTASLLGHHGSLKEREKTSLYSKMEILFTRLEHALRQVGKSSYQCSIDAVRFHVFGFGRGAALVRHFAHLVYSKDSRLTKLLTRTLGNRYLKASRSPSGELYFIGLFDTVARLGTPRVFPYNTWNADTDIFCVELPEDVAPHVYHFVAEHEFRKGYSLNAVSPQHHTLILPGSHDDLGGKFLEDSTTFILSEPITSVVPSTQAFEETTAYQQTKTHLGELETNPLLSILLKESAYDNPILTSSYECLDLKVVTCAIGIKRSIKQGYPMIPYALMHNLALRLGVPFGPIDQEISTLQIDPILKDVYALYDDALAQSTETQPKTQKKLCVSLSSALKRKLLAQYVQVGTNFNTFYIYQDKKREPSCFGVSSTIAAQRLDTQTEFYGEHTKILYPSCPQASWVRKIHAGS